MRKRVSAWLLSMLMIFLTAFSAYVPAMQVEAAGKTLIIHYGGRGDNNYEGWNLWIWEEGRDGQAIEFDNEDSFGKVAVYQTNRNSSKIGFIVRLNNWEDKDVAEDRFVSLENDVTEIWLTSGEAEFTTEAPDGAEAFDFAGLLEERLKVYDEPDALKLNVHYHNFHENYNIDNVSLYAWLGDSVGTDFPYVETDEYGAVFHAGFMPDESTTAGVKVIENGLVDEALEYTVDLSKVQDNTIDVYLVEGNPTLWYDKEEAVFTPVIAQAKFSESTSDEITLSLSKALSQKEGLADFFTVTDQNGNAYPIKEVEVLEKQVTLYMEEQLSLSNTYRVEAQDYEGKDVSMSKIIGSEYFDEQLSYDGNDLGAVYTKDKTSFRVWAPTATSVELNLYKEGNGDNLMETLPMQADVKGTWVCEKEGDLNGVYYTYLVEVAGKKQETVDVYAKAAGVNGDRGMVVDLASTNPEGFDKDVRPEFKNFTDAVIYELHVRDLSSDPSANIEHVGKFLGLTETGTKNADGLSTGLDHIKELGVTHVQILPSYDYATVDESKLDTPQFNWGYDPKNYNVPEGSYSTDPYHGEVRIKEMKQMIQTLHENGIRVNMDVVYNHTFNIVDSNFQKTVPDYYYRKDGDKYTNGSGCGNETASERAMVRKYIVDSVVYWATEYHFDGFRFDLMGVHDMETMKAVREALDQIDPTIMLYGEGWTGGESGLASGKAALKSNMKQISPVGAFNDDIRDGIKGNVFDSLDRGFVNGKEGMEESIKFGVVGSTPHPQVLVSKNEKKSSSWAKLPGQSINYASCHDNLTLWDKLAISNPEDSQEDRAKMNRLSSAIVLTSQGVPFMQAGEEMLRSKPSAKNPEEFEENSYCSPDSTNSIKWDNKKNVMDTVSYYEGLIAFRKAHNALRMAETEDIQNHLQFLSGLDKNVVAYQITGQPNEERAQSILVIYNANKDAVSVPLPQGEWDICVNGEKAGVASLGKATGTVEADGISCMVLVQGDDFSQVSDDVNTTENSQNVTSKKAPVIAGFAVAIAAVAGIVFGVLKKKKK